MTTAGNARVLAQLRRVRWAIRATLTLGVAASVAANILHAQHNPISQSIAAWPPLALLLTVELISRVPVHRQSLGAVRLLATALIAGIAAWVSYWHMAGVAAHYGETGASPYLMPVSVDGLVVVASVSLVELAGRIRTAEQQPNPRPDRAPELLMTVSDGQSTQDRIDTGEIRSTVVQQPESVDRPGLLPVPAGAFTRNSHGVEVVR